MTISLGKAETCSAGKNFGPIYCRLIRVCLKEMSENEELLLGFIDRLTKEQRPGFFGTYLLGFTKNELATVFLPETLRIGENLVDNKTVEGLFKTAGVSVWAILVQDESGILCRCTNAQ